MKVPPDWMHNCGDCADGLAQLTAGLATVREDPLPYMKARELLCMHMANTHPDALPGPIEGCPDYAEWQVSTSTPTRRASTGTSARVRRWYPCTLAEPTRQSGDATLPDGVRASATSRLPSFTTSSMTS